MQKVIGEAGTIRISVEGDTVADVALEESIVMAKAGSAEDGERQIAVQDSLLEDLLDDEDMEL